MASELPEVLVLKEAAQFLRVHPNTLLRLAQARRVPGRRVGGAWRFSRAALEKYLKFPEQPYEAEQKPADDLLTIAEAADFLNVSKQKVSSLGYGGHIPTTKVGSRRLFSRAALKRFIEGKDKRPFVRPLRRSKWNTGY